ncbi:MAG: fatty acid desaturase [Granulosicoccus sp.]
MNTSYPPLSEVRKTLRVKWYRCPIDHDRLRELSTRSDKKGWIQAGGHVGLYLVFVVITVALWVQQAWLAFMVSLWCLGFIATFFKGTSAHELGHGTVFKTKKLNVSFLHVVSFISWWDPYDYSASHTYHHRYTTHLIADRENVLPLTPSLAPLLVLQLCTINLFTKPNRNFSKGGFLWTIYLTARSALAMPSGHTTIPSQEWLEKLHNDQPETFRKSVKWSRTLLLIHGGILLISLYSGWWVLSLVISVPAFIANIGSYLLGTTQHCGLLENNSDFRKNTRSIKLNPVIGFLYWHMNWHAEHHMYAGVPCYNLRALALEIESDMPSPKSTLGAWKEMREIWRRQKSDPDYIFDTPVPHAANSQGMLSVEDVVVSIGDLAPESSELS